MKFKRIMLVTLALLAILTISSVSAIDDTLAEENTDELSWGPDGVEAVEQSISDGDADDALSYESSEFNVYINESMDLTDEDAAAVTFDVPAGAEGGICVYINSPETNWWYELDKSPLTLDDLNIYSEGTYSLNVSFIPNEGIELPWLQEQ